MVLVFPELKRVRGWYGGIEHWWCKLGDEIIDPTAAQFRPGGEYKEFREGIDAEQIGKCMNCGMEIWDKDPETLESIEYYGTSICSKECENSFMASLNDP